MKYSTSSEHEGNVLEFSRNFCYVFHGVEGPKVGPNSVVMTIKVFVLYVFDHKREEVYEDDRTYFTCKPTSHYNDK